MHANYIDPTPSGRVKLALLILLWLSVAVAMQFWWHPFNGFLKSLPICDALPWYRGIVVGFVLMSWLASASAASAAYRILKSGQAPFPGAWVWSRTKIRTGWRATIEGCLAAAAALVGFLIPVIAGYAINVPALFCFPQSCGC